MKEIWKAFNNLNNKITRIQDLLNSKFDIKTNDNANNIETLDGATTDIAEMLSDMNDAINDLAEMLMEREQLWENSMQKN